MQKQTKAVAKADAKEMKADAKADAKVEKKAAEANADVTVAKADATKKKAKAHKKAAKAKAEATADHKVDTAEAKERRCSCQVIRNVVGNAKRQGLPCLFLLVPAFPHRLLAVAMLSLISVRIAVSLTVSIGLIR